MIISVILTSTFQRSSFILLNTSSTWYFVANRFLQKLKEWFGQEEITQFGSSRTGKLEMVKILLFGELHNQNIVFRNELGSTFEMDYVDRIGTDFSVRRVKLANDAGERVAQIWEMSNLSKFEDLRYKYMTGSSGIVIVFDRLSLPSLDTPMQRLQEFINVQLDLHKVSIRSLPILLVNFSEKKYAGYKNEQIIDYIDKLVMLPNPKYSFYEVDKTGKIDINGFIDEFILRLPLGK